MVQVSGPDLEQLSELLGKLRDELAKEKTRWLGSTWPQLAPEQVITPTPGVTDVAQTLSLAIVGVQTGRLADGTRIVVRAGTSLDDALLPDGRPLRDVVAINVTLAPAAILRVNRQRTVELELGLDLRDVQRVVNAFPLPAGVSVTVTETN